MIEKYAQVIIDNKASSTDKPYTYLIEPEMVESIEEGMRVLVPFGRGNRVIKGIVINIHNDYEKNYKLKKIIDIIDDKPLISKNMIDLSLWMSKEYLSPYMDAFQTVLPPGDFKEVKTNIFLKDVEPKNYDNLNPLEKDIVKLIKDEEGQIELEVLKKLIHNKISNKNIRNLEEKGIIETVLNVQTSIEKKYQKYAIIKDKSISYEDMISIIGKRSYKQLEIAKYLWTIDDISVKDLMSKTNSSLSTVKSLEKKGVIEIFNKEIYRTPIRDDIMP
ncbi:MAG TPA: primosomal protein N', partial [Schnuerera sp.]|nr:primosomal protein N' [Schnuerera sp.]